MKKLLFFAALVLFFTNAKSQITKGNWLLGGNLSFTSTKFNSERGQKNTFYQFQIAPNAGYFLVDKVAAGLKANIVGRGYKSTGTPVYSTNLDFNLGPFVRYYFLPADKPFNLLSEVYYQYGFIGGGGNNQSTSKSTFGFNAGPVIYFNSSVGLEILLGYSSLKYAGFEGANGTIQTSIGIQVSLEKEK